MSTIIDDDFGDLSIVNIVNPYAESLESSNNLIDDDFGDLSIVNIVNPEHFGFVEESNEISPQPDPIDPVKSGIEVSVVESELTLASGHVEAVINESLENFDQTEKLEKIKSYKERIGDLPLHEQAVIALNETVENPLFFAPSKSYIYTQPYDLSPTKYQNELKQSQGKKCKEVIAQPNCVDTEYQTWREKFAKYF